MRFWGKDRKQDNRKIFGLSISILIQKIGFKCFQLA